MDYVYIGEPVQVYVGLKDFRDVAVGFDGDDFGVGPAGREGQADGADIGADIEQISVARRQDEFKFDPRKLASFQQARSDALVIRRDEELHSVGVRELQHSELPQPNHAHLGQLA